MSDDTVIPTEEPELPAESWTLPTDVGALSNEPGGEVAQSTAASGTRVPRWLGVGAAVAGVLVAFVAGYALNAGDADEVRHDLNGEIDVVNQELDDARGSLAAAETALDQCREAVEGAPALVGAAEDLAGNWQELQDLMVENPSVAVGSAKELELGLAVIELMTQMGNNVGAISASADRMTTDSEACASS